MKCFNHNEIDAIGICSICNKGVCSDCSKIINGRIICNDCYKALIEKGEINKIIKLDPKADYNYVKIFGLKMSINVLLLSMLILYVFTEIPFFDLAFVLVLAIMTTMILGKWRYERALLYELLKTQK